MKKVYFLSALALLATATAGAANGFTSAGKVDIAAIAKEAGVDLKAATTHAAPSYDEGEWVSIGNAQFQDGFIYPGFDGTGPSPVYEVACEQQAGTSIYRLVNPYKGNWAYADENIDETETTYIVIDCSDPENVVLSPQYSGFTGEFYDEDEESNYTLSLYIGNLTGYLCNYYGVSASVIKSYFAGYFDFDTLEDNKITFFSPCFGYDADECDYGWFDDNDEQICEAYLTLPDPSGVRTILGEGSEQGAAKYYTISGVAVSEPGAPGIYVCKAADGTVSKFTVK